MPRARNIKPGFFMNEDLADICPEGRLLFIGLWMLADREGRLEDRPKKIKAEIFPYENYDVDSLLNDLESKNFIKRYSLGNAKDMPRYIQVITFTRHQNPHPREAKSIIPPYDEKAETLENTKRSGKEMPRQSLGKTKVLPSHEKELSSNAESPFSESPFSESLNPSSLNPHSLNLESINDCADAQSHAGVCEVIVDKPVENLCKKRFAEFWEVYPRKTGKGAAEKAYEKIRPTQELHETMIRAVRSASLSRQWKKDGGQFIPNPATWLNQRRWEDEVPQETVYSEKADIADRAISMLERLEDNKNDEGSRCC